MSFGKAKAKAKSNRPSIINVVSNVPNLSIIVSSTELNNQQSELLNNTRIYFKSNLNVFVVVLPLRVYLLKENTVLFKNTLKHATNCENCLIVIDFLT